MKKTRGQFLRAAQLVLEQEGMPLSAKKITELAINSNLLKSKGRTPSNSMRARLSEELSINGKNSIFQRITTNKFALRNWNLHEDPNYKYRKFSKSLPAENLVCFDSSKPYFKDNNLNGIFSIDQSLRTLLSDRKNFIIAKRSDAEQDTSLKQLVSYVLLKTKTNGVLTYVRGKYSSADRDLLIGKRSLGFGGHVLDIDIDDLFSNKDAGVVNAARREVSEELKDLVVHDAMISHVIHDCTSTEGLKHLGVLVQYTISSDFDFRSISKELSINGIQLMNAKQIWQHFHLFEYWSQLVIREIFSGSLPELRSYISPSHNRKKTNLIIVVGEIASGKTSLTQAVCRNTSSKYISARGCLVSLLEIPDFGYGDRAAFQQEAHQFITSKSGPKRLAKCLLQNAKASSLKIIDGIRNIATIEALREEHKSLQVVYVDCPRDLALENFKIRSKEFYDPKKFIFAREHVTESELSKLRYEADFILFNFGTFDETVEIFTNWLKIQHK